MKEVFLIIGSCLIAFASVAQTSRTVMQLSDSEWKWSEKTETINPALASDLVLNQLSDVDSLTTSMSVVTEINVEHMDYNLVVLNLLGGAKSYDVYTNGVSLDNELSNENFHAVITAYALDEKIILMLKPKVNQSISDFEQLISNSNISFLGGVVLCHLDVKTDPFFGGKLIEVHVNNFLDIDVDGKIYARLYEADTQVLITENNNCAFARSGLEGNIEINFPDFDSTYEGKPLIVEVEMVDKEKNEEIIDQLTIPIYF